MDSDTEGGNKLLVNFGLFRAYGKRRIRMGRLTQTANPGETRLYLSPGLEWEAGDKIGIAPSDMRYIQRDYAEIVSYSNFTGETVISKQLSYYHYGRKASTESSYNGVDMRAEVYLLSRNIVIQGADPETPLDGSSPLPPWGC